MVADTKNNPLRKLIQQNKYTTEEVAKISNLSLSSLNRLMTGSNNDPRLSTLTPLASLFNVSIDELIGKKPLKKRANNDQDDQIITHVPLIHWEQIKGIHTKIKDLEFNNWDYWAVAVCNISELSYGLKIQNTSLPSPFNRGATIIVDPEVKVEDGDHAIIIHKSNPLLCLAVLVGTKILYKPLMFDDFFTTKVDEADGNCKHADYAGCVVQSTISRNIIS